MDIDKAIRDEWATIAGHWHVSNDPGHMKAVTEAWFRKGVLNILAAEHEALEAAVQADASAKKIPAILHERLTEIKSKLSHALSELPAVFRRNR